ncbi:GNAT family N-acetyltransferase [Vibrio sp. 10N.286.49.C2]|uniref:GNAT family N-acetyltransferase n=1 Tax=unclassified Vibrio TaxID=2614977 RepID=UPI000C86502C|nr:MULTISPECIES: N-acetyltransferase [unclassified Vibrio]PMH29576.1 GNAT family N-acetyltransferase [Vibrio sp. 10N.286.49.C2]PMH56091.1 GNAT family N-acetyltransferase [Vibrio sp. 10N.286.49.B1]PMH77648.1 GNAT family N-acetyltransferase [Vibrio sp. 10N.286.48.B7]
MLIRTEAPSDILVIDRLLKSVFDSDAEANLVMSLRENSKLTLSLIACTDEGEVIGHVLFTPVCVDGEDYAWQGLAPLAVNADHQGNGVATALLKEAFETLPELGYPACVVLGDPKFYGRFGFQSASDFGLSCQWEVPEGAFQARSLTEQPLSALFTAGTGLVDYSSEFNEL